jgi:hypothetical protein
VAPAIHPQGFFEEPRFICFNDPASAATQTHLARA